MHPDPAVDATVEGALDAQIEALVAELAKAAEGVAHAQQRE